MLVALPPLEPKHPFAAALGMSDPEELAPGVYRAGFDFNFDHDLKAAGYTLNEYPFQDAWRKVFALEPGTDEHDAAREAALRSPNDYGVADSWEQIVERWPDLITDERRFVIGMTEVRRADEPERDGWRWHKWGEYIGTHAPTAEYLVDEDGIDSVWAFHVYEVLSGPGLG